MSGTGADDIGPVEIEVLFFAIFCAAGYFGVGAMDKSINASVGSTIGDYIPDYVHWNHLLGGFYSLLIC